VQEKDVQGAISQYEVLLKKDPTSLAGYMGLGIIYDQRGEADKAEANYRKALTINKDFAPAANNLAWNLLEKGGNIDEALGFAQIAKEQMPKSASVMDTLGWIYYQKGSYLNAIQELQDGLTLEPNNAVINYHLGMTYYKNGQTDDAKAFLEKSLEIAPNSRWAKDANTTLGQIQAKNLN
jgi:tetratricopeptide (TPR) repeat protein